MYATLIYDYNTTKLFIINNKALSRELVLPVAPAKTVVMQM